MNHYAFTNIPGAGKNWVLVVTALSLEDAKQYIKSVHKSGKYLGIHNPSNNDYESMMCGAVTDGAELLFRERLQKVLA